jgi:arsenite-transporting ATPase
MQIRKQNKKRMDKILSTESKFSHIFTVGKGGVGKTTTSCALGQKLAAMGRRVLLISTDPAHNLMDVFQLPQGSVVPGKLKVIEESYNKNLTILEIAPAEIVAKIMSTNEAVSILDDGGEVKNDLADVRALPIDLNEFPNHMQKLLEEAREYTKSIPGVEEIIALVKVLESIERSEYDVVIFDTAPTGHTLRLMHLPKLMERVVQTLQSWKVKLSNYIQMASSFLTTGKAKDPPLKIMSDRLVELKDTIVLLEDTFKNPEKSTVIPVLLAETLPVMETKRLVAELEKNDIRIDAIIVNQLLNSKFLDDNLIKDAKDDLTREALELCHARAKVQQHHLKDIHNHFDKKYSVWEMPALTVEPKGISGLQEYSKHWNHDDEVERKKWADKKRKNRDINNSDNNNLSNKKQKKS